MSISKRIISVMVLGAAALWVCGASAEVKVDFGAYARTGFQVGHGGVKGENLFTNGFAKHNRLQEGQYFELGTTAHLPEDSKFVFTIANGGETFHYDGSWTDDPFIVRNLYFEVTKLPESPTTTAWFGSRMYRGNDIYLFDTWPVDNQNILGGGLIFGTDRKMEVAIGARAASTFSSGTSALGAGEQQGQRYLLIHKLELPMAPEKKLKTNLEFQYVSKSRGTVITPNLGDTGKLYVPHATGVLAGVQYPILGTNQVFARFGYGDVSSDVLTTPEAPDEDQPGYLSRRGSRAMGFGVSNAMELNALNSGLLYAAIYEWKRPRARDAASSLSTSIRPMHYFNSHLHGGIELDYVHYFAHMDHSQDINYFQISPMLEYALNRNVWGSPKFRLILSEAFYAREVNRYGEPVRQAFNGGLGIEVWF